MSDVVPETTRTTAESLGGRPARYDRRAPTQPAVSVIIPTFNEAENLPVLIARIGDALADLDFEMIVVDDDSPDRTWEVGQSLAEDNQRLHVIRRTDARGLSSAVLTGFEVAKGRTLAVLDADLQHDERILPDLVGAVLDGEADIAVGSRDAEGGSYGSFGPLRRLISFLGATLARVMLRVPVADPMSGFFVVSRERYVDVVDRVNPRGFKILLELLANGSSPRVTEIGYEFRERIHGATKLTGSVGAAYLLALIELAGGKFVTATFSAYAIVGTSGLVVRATAWLLLKNVWSDVLAWWIAIELAVLWNYWWNNRFTFNSYRHQGRSFWAGLCRFHVVALHGILVAIGTGTVAEELFGTSSSETVAPLLIALASVVIATAGNYHLNRSFTWRTVRS